MARHNTPAAAIKGSFYCLYSPLSPCRRRLPHRLLAAWRSAPVTCLVIPSLASALFGTPCAPPRCTSWSRTRCRRGGLTPVQTAPCTGAGHGEDAAGGPGGFRRGGVGGGGVGGVPSRVPPAARWGNPSAPLGPLGGSGPTHRPWPLLDCSARPDYRRDEVTARRPAARGPVPLNRRSAGKGSGRGQDGAMRDIQATADGLRSAIERSGYYPGLVADA